MRKVLVVILGIVVLCSLSFAGDTQSAQATSAAPAHTGVHKTMKGDHPLNNVIVMDASGTRSARCLCGKEFVVTKDSPTITRGEGIYYVHADGCRDMYMKSDKAAQTKMFSDYWKTYPMDKMANNTMMKDGKEMATCLCGKVFEVTKTSPKVTENGMTIYLCSDACTTALHGMAANDRTDKELAMLKTKEAPAAPAVAPTTPAQPAPTTPSTPTPK